MKTYNKAKAQAERGNFDKAWKIAQKDDGLSKDASKEEWIEWVKGNINTDGRGSNTNNKLSMLLEIRDEIDRGEFSFDGRYGQDVIDEINEDINELRNNINN